MKKIFGIIFILCLTAVISLKATAMTFEEAFNVSNKKPMLVLIYAEWADNYQSYVTAFDAVQTEFDNDFNFIKLNIASPETRFFNSRYHIYPNLPYVLMFRDGGKVSRYIQRDCVLNSTCMVSRVKSFIQ
jgi:Thioredoxin.